MSREILFRGLRLNDDGKRTTEWVYGGYEKQADGKVFITPSKKGIWAYEVDAATVGQFTGLEDKNGDKIFEGDVLMNHGDEDQVDNAAGGPSISVRQGHGDCTFSAGIHYFGGWGDGTEVELTGKTIHDQPADKEE